MRKNYFLGWSFGPVAHFAGLIIFAAGLALCFFYWSALMILPIGALVGFTYSSAQIDSDKHRMRNLHRILGFIPVGKWIPLTPGMSIGIRQSNVRWRTFSQSNRSTDIVKQAYCLVLLDQHDRELAEIAQTKTTEEASALKALITTNLNM